MEAVSRLSDYLKMPTREQLEAYGWGENILGYWLAKRQHASSTKVGVVQEEVEMEVEAAEEATGDDDDDDDDDGAAEDAAKVVGGAGLSGRQGTRVRAHTSLHTVTRILRDHIQLQLSTI